jgi:hypothetical protein
MRTNVYLISRNTHFLLTGLARLHYKRRTTMVATGVIIMQKMF